MRGLVVIALALLLSLPATAQQQQDGRGGQPGGRGQAGGRGQGGGRGGPGGGRGGAAAVDQQPAEPGFECFDRVENPEYPSAALQARIDGTAWVRIGLTAQGTIDKLEVKVISAWGTAPGLLGPPVEKVVRASKFKPECAGKTVAVSYWFALKGEATATPKTTVRRETSSVMYIESPPQLGPANSPARPATR